MRRFFCSNCRHPMEAEDGAVEAVCPNCQARFFLEGTNTGLFGTELAANRSGESLGPYLFEHLLGEGGMGQVYRAIDTRNGIRVAVKVFHPRLVTFPDLVERFRFEARTLRSVNHPGVVRLFEEWEERGLRYLAMELVPGVNLWKWRKENQPTLAQALDLVLQLCEVLAFVHPLGIVHRDLKPQNLMVTPEGALKVLDFGLARMVFADRTLTRTGTIVGTPQYMAPEQLEGREADHRTDLYAVGILLLSRRARHSR